LHKFHKPNALKNSSSCNHRANAVQGDHIGRIFAQWAIDFFGQFYKNHKSSQKILGYLFPKYRSCIYFDKKLAGLRFWVIFSQTHLVILTQSLVFSLGQITVGLVAMKPSSPGTCPPRPSRLSTVAALTDRKRVLSSGPGIWGQCYVHTCENTFRQFLSKKIAFFYKKQFLCSFNGDLGTKQCSQFSPIFVEKNAFSKKNQNLCNSKLDNFSAEIFFEIMSRVPSLYILAICCNVIFT
jgi:hypothetical protein